VSSSWSTSAEVNVSSGKNCLEQVHADMVGETVSMLSIKNEGAGSSLPEHQTEHNTAVLLNRDLESSPTALMTMFPQYQL
jgi:hypothetical protein